MSDLTAALTDLQDHAAADLPGGPAAGAAEPAIRTVSAAAAGGGDHVSKLVSALDPAFRAQEVGYAVTLIGRTIALTAAAERRSWLQRMLGRQPEGLPGSLSAAEARAAAHVQPHSVWLRNSIRAAAGLALAVLVARLTGVQHSFWVVLGALSVLRSNALSTGQDSLRALGGTVAGLLAGAAILQGIGTNEVALWILLPIAILLAGVAPAAISFAAGQAAFTLTLVILFNLIKPAGWQVGLLRLEGHRAWLRRQHRRRPAVLAAWRERRARGRRLADFPYAAVPHTWPGRGVRDLALHRQGSAARCASRAGNQGRSGRPAAGRRVPGVPGRARAEAGAAR
jgi:uncharacterized membrane protein YccC